MSTYSRTVVAMIFVSHKYILICILLLISIMFSKGRVTVKFQDVNVEYVNYEYIDEDTFDFSVNYINDTYNSLRLKAVVIKDFPQNLKLSLKIFGYALGSYRVPMGLDLDVSTCDLRSKFIFVAPFIVAVGGDLDKCAPEKGEYGNESFYPVNMSAIPPFFPKNKYRHDVNIRNEEIEIVRVQVYMDVHN